MTSQRDPDRLIRAYLEDGPNELPRRSYEAVDDRITRTRQRAGFGPWRESHMITISRALIGAATAVAVVIAFFVMGAPAPEGPGSSPIPSFASPTPSAGPLTYKWIQALAPGTYATSFSWDDSLRFTFTVGEGWEGRDINVRNGGHVSVAFFPIENVATDPCTRTLGAAPTSAEDVILAIGRLATVAPPPTVARIGGREALNLEFTIAPPGECTVAAVGLIKMPTQTCRPEVCSGLGGEWFGFEFGAVTHHHRLWVLEVGRRLIAIDAVWTGDATPDELAALQAVLDSVRLETPLATPPPSPAG